MIEPNIQGLSVGRQCALLSSFYYEPTGEPEKNLDLMRVIDKQFREYPKLCVWGSAHVVEPGHRLNRSG
ncbi:MAG: putative transposase [Paracoccaceae bacterium]|jgi:putative transposase